MKKHKHPAIMPGVRADVAAYVLKVAIAYRAIYDFYNFYDDYEEYESAVQFIERYKNYEWFREAEMIYSKCDGRRGKCKKAGGKREIY